MRGQWGIIYPAFMWKIFTCSKCKGFRTLIQQIRLDTFRDCFSWADDFHFALKTEDSDGKTDGD